MGGIFFFWNLKKTIPVDSGGILFFNIFFSKWKKIEPRYGSLDGDVVRTFAFKIK